MTSLETLGITDVQVESGFASTYETDDTPVQLARFKRNGIGVQVVSYSDSDRVQVCIEVGYGMVEYLPHKQALLFILNNT